MLTCPLEVYIKLFTDNSELVAVQRLQYAFLFDLTTGIYKIRGWNRKTERKLERLYSYGASLGRFLKFTKLHSSKLKRLKHCCISIRLLKGKDSNFQAAPVNKSGVFHSPFSPFSF